MSNGFGIGIILNSFKWEYFLAARNSHIAFTNKRDIPVVAFSERLSPYYVHYLFG